MDNHEPVPITQFDGLFQRGEDDTCPLGSFKDGLNFTFKDKGIKTRPGLLKTITLANIKRSHVYKRKNEAPRLLILNDQGQLFDSVASLVTPILTIAGMTDFSIENLYGRAYITPHNGTQGVSGEYIYVYDGTTCRKAGGAKPSGFTLSVTTSTAAGHIEPGLHLFAVAFETDTGFITPPGPTVFAQYKDGDDAHSIKFSNLPIGPAGTVGRWLLCTKVITTINQDGTAVGTQKDYEYFFIPNGRIANNVDVEKDSVSFFDAELVTSADYLFDELENIKAGIGLCTYAGRLCVWGEDGNESLVRISKQGEPESFSAVDGFVTTNPHEGGAVLSVAEYRAMLYIMKDYITYVTQQNGENPATWNLITLDKGMGSVLHGIAMVLDEKGSTNDALLIANREGIHKFEGTYPEVPLTWRIQALWKRINKLYFYKVQFAHDTVNKLLYISIPLDDATAPSHVIVGDYKRGLSSDTVRWSLWQFHRGPTSIMIWVNAVNGQPDFLFASAAGNVYKLDETITNDDGTAINCFILPVIFTSQDGSVFHCYGARFRAFGSGLLNLTLYSMDDAYSENQSIYLSLTPGRQYTKYFNGRSEMFSMKIGVSNADEYFSLIRMELLINKLWASYPL